MALNRKRYKTLSEQQDYLKNLLLDILEHSSDDEDLENEIFAKVWAVLDAHLRIKDFGFCTDSYVRRTVRQVRKDVKKERNKITASEGLAFDDNKHYESLSQQLGSGNNEDNGEDVGYYDDDETRRRIIIDLKDELKKLRKSPNVDPKEIAAFIHYYGVSETLEEISNLFKIKKGKSIPQISRYKVRIVQKIRRGKYPTLNWLIDENKCFVLPFYISSPEVFFQLINSYSNIDIPWIPIKIINRSFLHKLIRFIAMNRTALFLSLVAFVGVILPCSNLKSCDDNDSPIREKKWSEPIKIQTDNQDTIIQDHIDNDAAAFSKNFDFVPLKMEPVIPGQDEDLFYMTDRFNLWSLLNSEYIQTEFWANIINYNDEPILIDKIYGTPIYLENCGHLRGKDIEYLLTRWDDNSGAQTDNTIFPDEDNRYYIAVKNWDGFPIGCEIFTDMVIEYRYDDKPYSENMKFRAVFKDNTTFEVGNPILRTITEKYTEWDILLKNISDEEIKINAILLDKKYSLECNKKVWESIENDCSVIIEPRSRTYLNFNIWNNGNVAITGYLVLSKKSHLEPKSSNESYYVSLMATGDIIQKGTSADILGIEIDGQKWQKIPSKNTIAEASLRNSLYMTKDNERGMFAKWVAYFSLENPPREWVTTADAIHSGEHVFFVRFPYPWGMRTKYVDPHSYGKYYTNLMTYSPQLLVERIVYSHDSNEYYKGLFGVIGVVSKNQATKEEYIGAWDLTRFCRSKKYGWEPCSEEGKKQWRCGFAFGCEHL